MSRYDSIGKDYTQSSVAVGIKKRPYQYAISTKEMLQNRKSLSSLVNYDVPDTQASLYKIGRYQTQWKKEIPRRNTYVDKIFGDAKKPEKTVPGVGKYSPNPLEHMHPLEVRQKMSKEKLGSHIDQIFIKEKNTPGPQTYSTDEALKEKITGVYLG